MYRMTLLFHFSQNSKMNESVSDVSVADVYDIASEIGKEFGRIIDIYGTESVSQVLPKVICALESLEGLASKNERESTTMQELTEKITKLEMEKIEKAEDRLRFEAELEQIEEHWRQESKELLSLVKRLQDENRKLVDTAEKLKSPEKSSNGPVQEVDLIVLQRLRNMIDKQREQIRAKDKELAVKISEVETLSTQVEQLTTTGKELRRKHKITQGQVRVLIDERAEFLAQLQDQQLDIAQLRQRLGLVEKENADLSITCLEAPDLKNKAVYDLDDPNRPRFTTSELKEILQERNELKARVSDLEDELDTYRPKEKLDPMALALGSTGSRNFPSRWGTKSGKPPPTASTGNFPLCTMDAFLRFQPYLPKVEPEVQLEEEEEEELPVQGPLPYEPDDAPWKKSESESGIRKFFRKLFSETNISLAGPGPRRSFSTLSKMALSATTSDTSV